MDWLVGWYVQLIGCLVLEEVFECSLYVCRKFLCVKIDRGRGGGVARGDAHKKVEARHIRPTETNRLPRDSDIVTGAREVT